MTLTNRQQVFIEEYLQCWNASEAARRAGYTNRPNVAGPRLMANDSIRQAIQQRIAEKAMAADEVLARLAEQARVNIGDFIEVRDTELHLLYDEIKRRGHLVKKIGLTKTGPMIEVVDNQAALIQIAKILGLLRERQEITGANGGPIEHVMIYIPDNGRDTNTNADDDGD